MQFLCVLTLRLRVCYQDGWGNNETRDVADEEGSAFQVFYMWHATVRVAPTVFFIRLLPIGVLYLSHQPTFRILIS